MFDFNDIFKDLLATELPYTAGNVSSTLHLLSHTLTPRELMAKSKAYKAKIGKKRLMFWVIGVNADGSAKDGKVDKVWEDEFDELQVRLADYNYVGLEGKLPKFIHKGII